MVGMHLCNAFDGTTLFIWRCCLVPRLWVVPHHLCSGDAIGVHQGCIIMPACRVGGPAFCAAPVRGVLRAWVAGSSLHQACFPPGS